MTPSPSAAHADPGLTPPAPRPWWTTKVCVPSWVASPRLLYIRLLMCSSTVLGKADHLDATNNFTLYFVLDVENNLYKVCITFKRIS